MQSYFAGNKAGSDEVLKLACSILGMDAEQCRAVEVGARKFRQVCVNSNVALRGVGWVWKEQVEVGKKGGGCW